MPARLWTVGRGPRSTRWPWVVLLLLQPGCFLSGGKDVSKDPVPMLPPQETARLSLSVGDSLAAQGHIPEAICQYQKAHQLDPKLDVSRQLGRLCAAVGEDDQAREQYRLALEAAPKDADLWNDVGYYYYSRGDWKEAEKHLRKAVELNPRHARAWMNLGLALGQQEQYNESLKAFEKAVGPAEARCNLGFVYTTQGKRDEARDAYRSALKLAPGLKLARTALAQLDKPPVAPNAATARATPDARQTGGPVAGSLLKRD